MYGEVWGDSTWDQALWDVWALVVDTGIQYYALYGKNRAIAAVATIQGLMFAAVLTGRGPRR